MNDTQTLTAEAIDAMEAGREMDALVAERIFGGNVDPGRYVVVLQPGEDPYLTWPTFSTDIAAAWEVVEKVGITVRPVGGKWWAAVMHGGVPGMWLPADTAPLAICRAALKATLTP